MKRKLVWLGLSLLIIAAIVLSSCSKTTTTTTTTTSTTPTAATTTNPTAATTTTNTTVTTTTTTVTTAAVGTPQYGGQFTLLNNANGTSNADPPGWDHMWAITLGQGSVWGNPYLEKLMVGGIEEYGPRGTNQFAFNLFEQIPEQYYTGLLATSWEIAAVPGGPTVKLTFHLRKGVMFTGNARYNFAPREMTSADCAFSVKHAAARVGGPSIAYLTNVDTPDKYTLVWTFSTFQANWAWRFNGTAFGQIWAPETFAAPGGADDWRNQSGTGPYILTSFVSGAGATYTRNQNYWGTTKINGTDYQMPFIEKVYYPIIPDESTQIAAIRVGKIDWCAKVKTQYGPSLSSSSPALIQAKYLSGVCDYLKLNRLTSATMTNKNLRRALMIGTDLKAIPNLVYGGGEYFSWPFFPGGAGFVPLDQMPAENQEDWTFSIDNAKKIMAAAGYANGFKCDILVPSSNPTEIDLANVLVGMWAKVGITGTITIVDATAAAVAFDQVTYKDTYMGSFTVVNSFTAMNISRTGTTAGSIYPPTDPQGIKQENLYLAANSETDPVKRATLLTTLGLTYGADVGTIGFANPYVLNCYWPWFKNYYGELDASYYNAMPMIMRGWIDTGVKSGLGK